MDVEEIVLITLIIGASAALLLNRKRRWWVRPWIEQRETNSQGNSNLLHNELAVLDKENYKNFIRMDEDTFNDLLKLIENDIQKQDTKFRNAISAKDRLSVTLRYLATGESYKSLSFSFRMGQSTIAGIIPEVCIAIYNNLKNQYLKMPTTTQEWLKIANEFEERWNLPHVLGALDGKHVVIKAPANEGSSYFNYKHTHSIVLLALVDANYSFLYVDVGRNGKISDGGVYKNSSLAAAIETNKLNFPEERPLPAGTKPVPYVIVADAAFPLSRHILKPFPFRNMTWQQRIFNYRLSRARRVVENAFGILTNRFRVLLNIISLDPSPQMVMMLRNRTLIGDSHLSTP
ncbi:protein ANTAGONIST OF LIKE HETEROCHROMATIN PROTEIN 1-like isoform X2 [Photinus pyralis]|uniref:DDE Tnp4 domain-containing protein n=4 Tax=Photinus pyralis TaxID=7054 RepID=A0A1Y1M6H9_PHOPY|nr:protein ANTAGONIST OF LIKE HETEROCHROMATIN PROTEIN 1-like isoform X2 [Photinus pyralis]XP_031328063.1 protein ANTAGONIST OF LIKE HETEROCHROMATIN PROTEIN 1-like isoform X2 [Photinus pyralis]XP_031329301.1 protein ANTAGONIST OF LIKE HETEROCHROMATIN PROTEIN 1-like isoform X2 [Photinus pyralis]XP_031348816.1 protein ANTAGONIST OF LIKE HETEROCHROMATIN PROTEIN 1-like isoform X2 [Photinus pyralis]XP_031350910.1 protein ANTAGONIST OF LIKE HETEROCHROMATIN PROTEIN 1-like isoform X2 [Photinus pyralis]